LGGPTPALLWEANVCAVALGNMASEEGFSLVLYEHYPAQISLLMLADSIDISTL